MATQVEPEVRRRLFTVEEYHRLGEAGILGEDDRVELIEGEIVEMIPIGSPHVSCVIQLTWLLSRRLSDELRVSVQNPVRLGPRSELQPDLVVLPESARRAGLPGASDTLLVVEVADTSLAYDRDVKLALYARERYAEVWIVDLGGERVTRYTEPGEGGYGAARLAGRGQAVESTTVAGLSLAVDEILS